MPRGSGQGIQRRRSACGASGPVLSVGPGSLRSRASVTGCTPCGRKMGFGSGSAEPSHARSRWVRPGPRAFRGMPRDSGQGIPRRRSACGAVGRSCLVAQGLSGPGPRPCDARLAGGNGLWFRVSRTFPCTFPVGQTWATGVSRNAAGFRSGNPATSIGVRCEVTGLVGRPGVSQVPGLGHWLHAVRAENGLWFRVSRTFPCSLVVGQTDDASVSRNAAGFQSRNRAAGSGWESMGLLGVNPSRVGGRRGGVVVWRSSPGRRR
jgi:hypothetical protein